jgi:magnesium transporter
LLTAIIPDHYYDVASLRLVVPFIPLVLALASGVTAQSVSLALQMLHGQRLAWTTQLQKAKLELAIGALLGITCGMIAGIVVFIWTSDPWGALSLGASIVGSVSCAAVLGVAMPSLVRRIIREPQVAAGPIALACADVVSLLIYFNVARWLLA